MYAWCGFCVLQVMKSASPSFLHIMNVGGILMYTRVSAQNNWCNVSRFMAPGRDVVTSFSLKLSSAATPRIASLSSHYIVTDSIF